MARTKRRPRQTFKTPPSYSELAYVSGGRPWHALLVLLVLFIAGLSIWLDPGVTRPYPAVAVVLGGVCAVVAGLVYPFIALSARGRVTLVTLMALELWLVLSTVFSIDLHRSQQSLASWIGACGLCILIVAGATSGRRWYFLVAGLCASASLLCAYGLLQAEPGAMSATFSNSDSFSVVPLAATFLALSLTRHPAKLVRLLSWGQIALYGIAILRSTSRSAVGGLIVGLLVHAAFISMGDNKKEAGRARIIALFLPLVIALIAVPLGLMAPISDRMKDLSKGNDIQGVSMREDVLVHGLRASLSRPLLGSGPGTFAMSYQQFRPSGVLPDYMYVNVAHNDLVEVAVEFGWLGFALAGLFWLLVMSRPRRLIKLRAASWEAASCSGGVSALLAFSCLNFIISVPCLLYWELVLVGLLLAVPVKPQPTPGRVGIKLLGQSALLIALGVWSTWFSLQAFRANRLIEQSDKFLEALRWESAQSLLDKAVSLQPSNSALYLARGKAQSQHAKLAGKKPGPEVAQDFETAVKLSPRDPKVLRAAVNHYTADMKWQRAEELLKAYVKLRPYAADRFTELTRLQLLRGELRAASETLHEGAMENAELRPLLVTVLADLETTSPGEAALLLRDWLEDEGGAAAHSERLTRDVIQEELNRRQPAAATRLLDSLKGQDVDDAELDYYWSKVYRFLGKRPEELAKLNKLIRSNRNSEKDVRFITLALLDWARQQPDFLKRGNTFHILLARLKAKPDNVNLRLTLSEILIRMGRLEAAQEILNEGLDLNPEDADLLARQGSVFRLQGQSEQATNSFEMALSKDPKNAEAQRGAAKQPIRWTN